ncbi:MAG: hypothetical protein A2173_03835 [Planctomycetes bacterium RBG_13_44_8b]|nr:MAG: hypothetical protein A2173_03835 [Planctomycetes bacterium RBG_13_44_8b]
MEMIDVEIERKCRQYIADSKNHTSSAAQKERAQLNQDFFRGGTHQWTAEEYEVYRSKGVTPITLNRCKPVLKGLLGMYLQGKQDVRVRPRRSGSSTVAQVHTELLKHTQDVSYADYVYANVFLRAGIDTESYLKLRIDRGMNVNGQPVIEGKSIWQISVDRNAIEYDLNESAAYIIERDWKDQDEIKALYPDQHEKITQQLNAIDEFGQRPVERLATYMTSESDTDGYDDDESEQLPDMELLKKYRYQIHTVWWKEIKPALIVGDRQNQTMTTITDEKKISKLNRKAKKSVRFVIHNYAKKVLHETAILGNHMLDDTPDPLGPDIADYPIVRFSPLWDLGYAIGVLDDIVSLNKEENIHRTQMTRLLNQTANTGWIVGTDNNKPYINLLKNLGSIPGIIIPKDKFGGSIEKIQPTQLPVGHYTMANQFEQDIKRVSGVDDATQGYETGKNESGRAIGFKMQNNRMSNEIFFDNFYRTLEIFGNLLLKVQLANDFYTNDEIKDIVSESSLIDSKLLAKAKARMVSQIGADLPEPQPLPPLDPMMMQFVRPEDQGDVLQIVQQGVQSAQQYAKAYPQLAVSWEEVIRQEAVEMLLKELRNDKGMYGTKVTISPSAPTERMAQFIQMDALMKNYGQLIPPDIFIDLTDLPQKEEIKARIQQQMQQQQQMQSQQRQVRPAAMRGAAA